MNKYNILRLFLCTVMIMLFIPCKAQTARCNYNGEISVGSMVGLNANYGTWFNIQTAHGISFNDGAFVGIGTGMITDMSYEMLIPVYVKASQTFALSHTIKPYASISVGVFTNDDLVFGMYAVPELGIQLSRVRLFANYSMLDNTKNFIGGDMPSTKVRNVSVGVSFVLGRGCK